MKWNRAKFWISAFLLSLVACSDDNTAGVTEDDNPAVAQKESSSSVAVSSSGGVSEFNLWDGSTGVAKINFGNENIGYWYGLSDRDRGGVSKLVYPEDAGIDHPDSSLDDVVEYCGGLCGTAELKQTRAQPWVGVAFTLAEEGSTADISEWGGICVTYASDYPIDIFLNVHVDGFDSNSMATPFLAYPAITLPKTTLSGASLRSLIASPDLVVTRCAKWSDFRVSSWAEANASRLSKVYSGEEAAKEIRSIMFIFAGNSDGSGNFIIKGLGTYDASLPQWGEPVGKYEVQPKVLDGDSLTCLWKGLNATSMVNTGYNDLDEFAGMWDYFDASSDSAGSWINLPAAYPNLEYEPGMYDGVVMVCDGFCGTMKFSRRTGEYAAAGVTFNIAGYEDGRCEWRSCNAKLRFADISEWGGMCITYFSEKEMQLKIVTKDVPYEENPTVLLPKSDSLVEECFAWSDFAPQRTNMGSAVSSVQFIARSDAMYDSSMFNIVAVGKYSANGACAVEKPAYKPKSSSSARSSSSAASSSSFQLFIEEQCLMLRDLWSNFGNVNTGFPYMPKYEYAGRWYKIEDTSNGKKSIFSQPLTEEEFEGQAVIENGGVGFPDSCTGTRRTDLYDGVCGTAEFKDDYFAGLGFYVAGFDSKTDSVFSGDVEEKWGGICVTYASEADVDVVMNSSGVHDVTQLPTLPKVTLPKSSEVVTQCLKWDDFKSADGKSVNPKNLTTVNFIVNGEKGTKKKLNILGLGKYATYEQFDYSLKCAVEEHFI